MIIFLPFGSHCTVEHFIIFIIFRFGPYNNYNVPFCAPEISCNFLMILFIHLKGSLLRFSIQKYDITMLIIFLHWLKHQNPLEITKKNWWKSRGKVTTNILPLQELGWARGPRTGWFRKGSARSRGFSQAECWGRVIEFTLVWKILGLLQELAIAKYFQALDRWFLNDRRNGALCAVPSHNDGSGNVLYGKAKETQCGPKSLESRVRCCIRNSDQRYD